MSSAESKRHQTVLTVFTAELLLLCKPDLNVDLDLGLGLTLSQVTQNLNLSNSPTGITGVYIDPNGPSFRALMGKTTSNLKTRAKNFFISTHGYQKAFQKAVEQRGTWLGFVGDIPKLTPPAISVVYRVLESKMSAEDLRAKDVYSFLLAHSSNNNSKG